ncbi:MJ0042-type zinc finger domain-containing protein [Limosilactobacillus sp.]|uniref:MJ0042-type zinc finger domain-containing protein n=1 Tax=Limosilactobacillus sp. TaxID=2773925 RepID=UPI00338FD98A
MRLGMRLCRWCQMRERIRLPSVKREWIRCPKCNTKIAIADSDAVCRGVHIKCRTCKTEIEIRI